MDSRFRGNDELVADSPPEHAGQLSAGAAAAPTTTMASKSRRPNENALSSKLLSVGVPHEGLMHEQQRAAGTRALSHQVSTWLKSLAEPVRAAHTRYR